VNVRAVIEPPGEGESLPRGETVIRGVAWSGAAGISRVDVSLNNGPWRQARLVGERRRGAWQWWELITRLEQTGSLAVLARATDTAGRPPPAPRDPPRYRHNSSPPPPPPPIPTSPRPSPRPPPPRPLPT